MTQTVANAVAATVTLLWWSVALESIVACSGYQKASLTSFEVGPYKDFIDELRRKIPTKGNKDGIKLLQKSPQGDKQFVLVELKSDGKEVTLALDSADLYVLGYQVGADAWIFDKIPSGAADKLYPDKKKQNKLGFEGSYTDLERQAGSRGQIKLGMLKLKDAALLLAKYPSGKDGKTDKTTLRAEALLVIIQMVSEAARFKYIEKFVTDEPWSNRKPSSQMLTYELNWESLAGQIRKGNTDPKLKEDVYLVKP